METRPEPSRDRRSLQDVRGIKEAADLGAEHPGPSRPREQPSHPPKGGDPADKGSNHDTRPRVRLRQGTRVRVVVSAAAQVVGGGETRDGKRREERAGRPGRAEPWGARARPLVAGGEYAHQVLTARPSPGEARAPAARACAARRPLERALSDRARARNLRHPPAQAPAAAPPPPPPTFCRRHHSHFLLCLPLLSSPSVDYQVSARLRNLPPRPPGCTCIPPPLSSEMGFMRWALVGGNGGGRSLRPLRSSAGIDWGDLERDPCKGCTRVCVYVLCVCGGGGGCLHDPLHADPAEVVPTGWGADGGDLGEGAAMHARTPSFAAMGV